MRWAITDPRGIVPALQGEQPELEPYPEPGPRRLDWIVEHPPLSREKRLDVYAEAYYGRIRDALLDDFPTLSQALGGERFNRVVAEYLSVHPSSYYNVSEVGCQLSAFLRGHRYQQAEPYLADLAALDWATQETFYADDAEDRPPLDAAALAAIPPEAWSGLRFRLDPAVRTLRSAWTLDAAWGEKNFPDPLPSGPCRLLIHRAEGEVYLEPLDETSFAILEAMRAGRTLGEIGDALSSVPDAAAIIQERFAEWLPGGVIREIY